LIVATEDWIGLVIKTMELGCQTPALLHEFKLTFDVGVQAHKQDSSLLALLVATSHPQ